MQGALFLYTIRVNERSLSRKSIAGIFQAYVFSDKLHVEDNDAPCASQVNFRFFACDSKYH